jgi:hypothetical protein
MNGVSGTGIGGSLATNLIIDPLIGGPDVAVAAPVSVRNVAETSVINASVRTRTLNDVQRTESSSR